MSKNRLCRKYRTKSKKQLNGTNLPFPYEIYAIYEADSKLSYKAIHKIIEELNPKLKLNRNREFFDVSSKVAYLLFENMVKIHNTSDKLKLFGNFPRLGQCNVMKTSCLIKKERNIN